MVERDRRYGWGEDRERWGRDRDERRGGFSREHDEEHRERGAYFQRARDEDWRGASSDWGGREDEWRGRDYGSYERGMTRRDEDWRGRDYGRDDEHGGYGRTGLGERGGWGGSHATGGYGAGQRDAGTTGMGLGGRTSTFGTPGGFGYSSSYGTSGGYGGYGRTTGGYGTSGYGTSGYGRGEQRDWERERGMGAWERDRDRDRWERDRDRDREEGGFFQRMGEGIRNAFGLGERDRERGPFFGKGPKGYKRSDERVREEVSEVIARQGWIDASEVEVKVVNGEVTLTGTVSDREHKRRLEQMIEDVHGVDDVRNELRVRRTELHTQTGTASSTTTSDTSEPGTRGRNARSS
ncbi:BON domain-containing protein [Sandaracinus amylolyticus]|uniref:BON domain-containing protein n=1 Tax=Sandaracinus amylolyticus TaxID=927083 RepID=UPI001F42319A|nr:BON domain-containing protein [Sandaracinus amylolyticus]UJR83485.1 Hypothetical protein I5071_55530 [Sandaracinus amylolyticus]